MNDINEKIDLIKGVLKTNLETYGDLLVTLYHKVKKGGALTTTPSEREVLYKLANKYQSKLKKNNNNNKNNPLSEIDFSNLVKGIGDNIVVKQMVQWGGSEKNLNKYHKYHQKSKRLKILYLDYINYYNYYKY